MLHRPALCQLAQRALWAKTRCPGPCPGRTYPERTAAVVLTAEGDPVSGHNFPPSPVPGDRDLWPGETPFTDWGQFGIDGLDLRVFDQDDWWVNRLGQPHLLVEMSKEYIGNVITHLEENASFFYYGTMRRNFIQMLGDACYGHVNAEMVAQSLGASTLSDAPPVGWLESTP